MLATIVTVTQPGLQVKHFKESSAAFTPWFRPSGVTMTKHCWDVPAKASPRALHSSALSPGYRVGNRLAIDDPWAGPWTGDGALHPADILVTCSPSVSVMAQQVPKLLLKSIMVTTKMAKLPIGAGCGKFLCALQALCFCR